MELPPTTPSCRRQCSPVSRGGSPTSPAPRSRWPVSAPGKACSSTVRSARASLCVYSVRGAASVTSPCNLLVRRWREPTSPSRSSSTRLAERRSRRPSAQPRESCPSPRRPAASPTSQSSPTAHSCSTWAGAPTPVNSSSRSIRPSRSRTRTRRSLVSPSAGRTARSSLSPRRDLRRPAATLALLAFAMLIVSLDQYIVVVALPEIGRALGYSTRTLQAVISAYAVASAGFLLLGGRASDLLGRRRVLVAGLTLYAVGSLVGGLAPTPVVLLVARAVQGLGGALVFPSTLALVN